ncbi:signal transduction histidine kinase [Archangium gephyra]|uniref:histidine kinase n=1 Tax=Archangium gephyra TaxID=48 RepID=A0ABX9K567_9BACT|nr:ATP-binding protein [Archangium gephyra]REG33311.1 signal transduction histidine kinase [Archangium gephyra]
MSVLRRIGCGLGLGLAGGLLNLAALEVLPGVHLLLGPLLVLTAGVLCGPVAGALAGAVSGVRTLWLWGHPWGWLNLTLEGLFVGALRRRVTPVVADALYWGLSPLYFLVTYFLLEDIPTSAILVAGLKQAVNGLLAALILQVVLLLPSVRRRLRALLPLPLVDLSLGRAFGSALTLGALIPLLVLGGAEGRERYTSEVRQLDEANLHAARVVANEIESSLEHARHGVSRLARSLSSSLSPEGALPGPPFLEGELDALVTYSPEVLNAYVGSPEGVALAFSPRTDAAGRPLVGMDFSDRAYVQEVRRARGPLVSDVFLGRGGSSGPLVVTLAPIRRDEQYAGYVLAAVDLPRLRRHAQAQIGEGQRRILVVDTRGGLVFDSAEEGTEQVRSIISTALARALEQAGPKGTGTYEAEQDAVTLVRMSTLQHFGVVEVAPLGWRVVVQQPGTRLQRDVERSYFGLLGTLGLATVSAVLLALTFSRTIVAPVQGVSHAAARLAAGERSARAAEAAQDAPRELNQLAETFDRMAWQLSRQLEAIERTSREKDAFLSIASHELKTPLTALKAQVQLLRRKLGDEHTQRLDNVSRQVDRVTRLVNQLLDASQLGLEQLPLQRTRMDLSEVVRRVAESLVSASPLHTLELEAEPVVGDFDELRLEQVVHNLVSNAIKYSPTGGTIQVWTRRRPEGEAELVVADRGIGLRVEDEEQLFGRFERGDRRELTGIAGIGVGLYVSREIIRRHGGRISLRPREGGGAVATVRLPAAVEPEHGRRDVPAHQEEGRE